MPHPESRPRAGGGIRRITREEAAQRSRSITVLDYDIDLDLTTGSEHYGTTSRVRFTSRDGDATFIELLAPAVHSIVLNGLAIDPAVAFDGERLSLSGLRTENELTVVAQGTYSRTSEGLHRFEDPADGEVYIYSQSFLYDAHRLFACFDQPDLKAPLRLSVTAPTGWTVLGNAPGIQLSPGRWAFERTPPIATYVSAVVAGPYHSVYAEHDGIPLGVHCRRSLARYLEADEVLDVTRGAFDHYHRSFGIRYPFAKYDQIFAPEFNGGAMENIGCVTFAERFIFRSRVTEVARESRARVIAHELAHMWVGNLVTMRWWDDLWLSESFADYLAHGALIEVTRFQGAWATFCARGKQRGYDQDQGPSTHPVAGRVADSAAALQDFDGISYVKGASILKQLAAWLGSGTFERGLRAYLSEHRFGSVAMDDLLRALSRAGGNSLDEWAAAWLLTAGVDTLRPEARVSPDGAYESVAVLRTPPSGGTVDRPHRIAIGLYDRVGERLLRRDRLELDVTGARTEVPGLAGVAPPDLLLLNEDDLSWAKIRFDERSLRTVLDGGIARLDGLMARSLAWSATWHMTRDGELPASDFVRLVLDGLSKERDVGLMEQTLSWARRAIDAFSGPQARSRRLADLADRCLEVTRMRADEPDVQLAAAQAFVSAMSGRAQVDLLKSWLDGEQIPAGLAIDNDLRWRSLERLAVIGQVSSERIAQEMEADRTFAGQVHGTEALASLPTAEAKAAAWSAVMEQHDLSNHMSGAMARAFWQHEQLELGQPYVERYFETIPTIWGRRTLEMSLMIARLMYPAVLVESETLERTDAALAAPDLDAGLRRVLAEGRDELRRALACRQADGQPWLSCASVAT